MANDDGPAFPRDYSDTTGMSLRDYFAAQALRAVLTVTALTSRAGSPTTWIQECAHDAYIFADAMLEERNKW